MAKRLLYYYYYENDKCIVYDSHIFRGSVMNPAFKGREYSDLLGEYSRLTGKTMMHSTSKRMDNWRIP